MAVKTVEVRLCGSDEQTLRQAMKRIEDTPMNTGPSRGAFNFSAPHRTDFSDWAVDGNFVYDDGQNIPATRPSKEKKQ